MVQQTRQVVENYVLYKIHSSLDVEDYSTDGASCVDQESPLRIAKRLPIPQQYSQTDLAVQSIACQYETRYKDIFPDVLEELRYVKFRIAVLVQTRSTVPIRHQFADRALPGDITYRLSALLKHGVIVATVHNDSR